MSLDDEQLAEIERRAATATAGPWRAGDAPYQCSIYSEHANICILMDGGTQGDEFWRNREFITHAREDVPALIAEVKRLRSIVASLMPGDEGHD